MTRVAAAAVRAPLTTTATGLVPLSHGTSSSFFFSRQEWSPHLHTVFSRCCRLGCYGLSLEGAAGCWFSEFCLGMVVGYCNGFFFFLFGSTHNWNYGEPNKNSVLPGRREVSLGPKHLVPEATTSGFVWYAPLVQSPTSRRGKEFHFISNVSILLHN